MRKIKWVRTAQIGDEVYVKKYKVIGEVREVLPNGRISKVAIQTPRGEQIIDTINLIVKIVLILDGLIPTIRRMFQSIFRKKKQ